MTSTNHFHAAYPKGYNEFLDRKENSTLRKLQLRHKESLKYSAHYPIIRILNLKSTTLLKRFIKKSTLKNYFKILTNKSFQL